MVNKNTKYRQFADSTREGIRSGEIPVGTPLIARVIGETQGLKPEVIKEGMHTLKLEGFVGIERVGKAARGYVVISSEGHGGSPERG